MKQFSQLPVGLEPLAVAETARTEAQKILAQLPAQISFLIVTALAALNCSAIEVTLLFTVIDMMFGAALPSDPTPLPVIILSLASVAMIAGFHILLEKHKGSRIAETMRGIARAALPVYFLCIFAVFIFHGLEMGDGGTFALNGFVDAEPGFTAWVLQAIEPYITLLMSLAFGGVIFVTLAVADNLISQMRQRIPQIIMDRHTARATLAHVERFLSLIDELIEVEQQKQALQSVTEPQLALRVAAEVSILIQEPLREFKKVHFEIDGMQPGDSPLPPTEASHLPHPLPKSEVLKAFIDACDALVQRLPVLTLSAMRGQINNTQQET